MMEREKGDNAQVSGGAGDVVVVEEIVLELLELEDTRGASGAAAPSL